MKSSSFTLAFFGCLTAGAAFAACSSETVVFPANTGGGSSGGSTSSSSASSSSASGTAGDAGGSTSSSTTSSSSGGGGDTCEQACTHAEACSVPLCNFFPLDCADPRAECGAQCLLDATCEQIESLPTMERDEALVGCIMACQSSGTGGTGGAGGTGGTGGGPSGQQCGICALQNRCLPDCGDDTVCQDWLQCAQDCLQNDPQPTCFRACDGNFPDAAGIYGDAYDCTCTSCVDDCGDVVDPCNATRVEARGM